MPKSTHFPPVITQTGGAQVANINLVKVTSITLDPTCSQYTGDQTVNHPLIT